ncbi:MAG: hypothetical protein DHS20C16_25620 [Phycisphaerae bacterium]|nr:MAG: hypothetical protein DHS20C16_25620 [Phycisphaerae bacterium]
MTTLKHRGVSINCSVLLLFLTFGLSHALSGCKQKDKEVAVPNKPKAAELAKPDENQQINRTDLACNLEHQLRRLNEFRIHSSEWHKAYDRISNNWLEAIQDRIDSGEIQIGMKDEVLRQLLGEPTREGKSEDLRWIRYYFGTSMHVNPAFDVEFKDDSVVSFRFTRA